VTVTAPLRSECRSHRRCTVHFATGLKLTLTGSDNQAGGRSISPTSAGARAQSLCRRGIGHGFRIHRLLAYRVRPARSLPLPAPWMKIGAVRI